MATRSPDRYQADCFTPKKVLQRSPPSKTYSVTGKENRGVSHAAKRKPTGTLSSNNQVQNRRLRSIQAKAKKEKSLPKGEKYVQDACFTPQKCLQRSPPPSQSIKDCEDAAAIPPSSHWELPRTPTNLISITKDSFQKESSPVATTLQKNTPLPTSLSVASDSVSARDKIPPTSHWEIQRTPPTKATVPPTSQSELARTPPVKAPLQSELRDKANGGKISPPISQQELCHTPPTAASLSPTEACASPPASHWELPRTPTENPPPTSQFPLPSSETQKAKLPTSHWELPRTPPTQGHQPCSLMKCHIPRRAMFAPPPSQKHSPSRATPLHQHPLCQSNRASPALSLDTHSSQAQSSTVMSHKALCAHKEDKKETSPAIMHADAYSLPGLKCTEEDLAFIQRLSDLKQCKTLQTEHEKLSKLEKVMVEEKEQLEQTFLKVKNDLDSMKSKYQETVSILTALIADPSLLSATQDSTECSFDLSKESVAQLRKMKQLDAAQLDKTDAKLKTRVAELKQTKQELQQKIRQAEESDMHRRAQLHAKLQSLQDMKVSLESKIKDVTAENSSAKTEVENLQGKLGQLEISSHPAENSSSKTEGTAMSSRLMEKQRAEERLKKIIYRCEMYVKRHQILKEMGIKAK